MAQLERSSHNGFTPPSSQNTTPIASANEIDLSSERFSPAPIRQVFSSVMLQGSREPAGGDGPSERHTSSTGGWRYSAAMLGLNATMLGLTTAYLCAFGYVLTEGLPPLVERLPLSLIVGSAGLLVVERIVQKIFDFGQPSRMIKADHSRNDDNGQRERIISITSDLCQEHRIRMPVVCVHQQGPAIIDRLFAKDILLIPHHFAAGRTDRELRAVIAHELAHIGGWSKHLFQHNPKLLFASAPVVLTSTFSYLYPLAEMSVGWKGAYGVAGLGAGLAWIVVSTLSERVINWCRRNREYATDLRSIRYTGDPEGAVKALQKEENRGGQHGSWRSALLAMVRWPFLTGRTHPSIDNRIKMIERVFPRD